MKVTVRKSSNNGKRVWLVDYSTAEGRIRKFFKSKDAAESEAESIREQVRTTGESWLSISASERHELMTIHGAIKSAGLTIRTVWDRYRAIESPKERKTLGAAIAATIRAKSESGCRVDYVSELESYLGMFARGREDIFLDSVSLDTVKDWFAGRSKNKWTIATGKNRLSTLFSYSIRQGWLVKNPCENLEKIRMDYPPPKILTHRQVLKCLAFSRRRKPRFLGYLALTLFAGLRPEEADGMTWGNFQLERGLVIVDSETSKVRARRIVHLEPAAVEWLKEAKRLKSDLPLDWQAKRRALRALRELLGFPSWPKDILRHTCASHLIALHQDAAKVALELGNSPGVLLRHYRELVTKESAVKFWGIRPSARAPSHQSASPKHQRA